MTDDIPNNTETAKPPEKPFHQGTANLKPAQPGEVRNPAGKPKGTLNRKTLFRNMLEAAAVELVKKDQQEALGSEFAPQSIAEQIVANVIIKALRGDMEATTMALDNSFDKLADNVNHTGNMSMQQIVKQVQEMPKAGIPDIDDLPPSPLTQAKQCLMHPSTSTQPAPNILLPKLPPQK